MPNPWADAAAAFAQLAELATPPVVPNGARILDYELTNDLWAGQSIPLDNLWTEWLADQPFEVVGQSAQIPVLVTVQQAALGMIGTTTNHGLGSLRINIDNGDRLARLCGWTQFTSTPNAYMPIGGGGAVFLLAPGSHSLRLEALTYYRDTKFYLRHGTYPELEWLQVQVTQLGA